MQAYECADAYFALHDAGYDNGGWSPLWWLSPEDVTEQHRSVLAHWRESMVPNTRGRAMS